MSLAANVQSCCYCPHLTLVCAIFVYNELMCIAYIYICNVLGDGNMVSLQWYSMKGARDISSVFVYIYMLRHVSCFKLRVRHHQMHC